MYLLQLLNLEINLLAMYADAISLSVFFQDGCRLKLLLYSDHLLRLASLPSFFLELCDNTLNFQAIDDGISPSENMAHSIPAFLYVCLSFLNSLLLLLYEFPKPCKLV